jgi:hypothetical protein
VSITIRGFHGNLKHENSTEGEVIIRGAKTGHTDAINLRVFTKKELCQRSNKIDWRGSQNNPENILVPDSGFRDGMVDILIGQDMAAKLLLHTTAVNDNCTIQHTKIGPILMGSLSSSDTTESLSAQLVSK